MDLLSASDVDDDVNWYENDGNQNFTKITINSTLPNPTDVICN